jgi:hypothetical protein
MSEPTHEYVFSFMVRQQVEKLLEEMEIGTSSRLSVSTDKFELSATLTKYARANNEV